MVHQTINMHGMKSISIDRGWLDDGTNVVKIRLLTEYADDIIDVVLFGEHIELKDGKKKDK